MGWTYILLEGYCGRRWPQKKLKYRMPKKLFKCPLKKCVKLGAEVRPNIPQEACLHVGTHYYRGKYRGKICPMFGWGNVTKEFERLKVYKDLWRKQSKLDRMFEKAKKRLGKKPSRKVLNKLWDDCMKKVGGK